MIGYIELIQELIPISIDLIEKYHKELYADILEFSREKTAETLYCSIKDENKLFLICLDVDDDTKTFDSVGFVSGIVTTALYTKRKIAKDLGFYVKPEYRNKGIAKAFLGKLCKWTKDKGALFIDIADSSLIDSGEPFHKSVKKSGFTKSGIIYRKMLWETCSEQK